MQTLVKTVGSKKHTQDGSKKAHMYSRRNAPGPPAAGSWLSSRQNSHKNITLPNPHPITFP